MTVEIAVTQDLPTCLALRHRVFVEEQGVTPEEEQDGRDPVAIHLLASSDGTPVGTARLLIEGATGKIGRVCVLPVARGTGLGAKLIAACLEHLRGLEGVAHAQLGAQVSALGFYEKLGFEAFGPVFDDAGLPHQSMARAL